MNQYLLLVVLMVSGNPDGLAQDSIATDSTHRLILSLQQQLDTYERLMLTSKAQRKQDSVARADLIRQIQLLQENDKVTRQNLQNQIRDIIKRDSLRSAEQRQKILEMRVTNSGFPVAPYEDTLFFIYTKLGPVRAAERAATVSEKIKIMIRDDLFYPDSLRVVEREGTVDIMYKDLIVGSISDWDALWSESSKLQLANSQLEVLKEYIASKRNRSSIQNIAARVGLVFLIMGFTILIIYFINRLADGFKGKLVQNRNRYFKGFKIGTYEVLPPNRQLEVSIQGVALIKWIFYALILYLSLPIIFNIFPFTKGWAQTLLDWILQPARNILYSFWNFLPNFFTIAVIFIITRYLVKILKFIAQEIESDNLHIRNFHTEWAIPTFRLMRFLIYAFMIVVIYPYLPGSDTQVFKGASIFIGLLISLGSTSAIGNAVAGLVITYMRPFKIGDRVTIGQVTGNIVEKTLLVTRVRTTKNEDITVPNSSILTGHTINYTSNSDNLGLIVHTSVTIGYDVPWRKVYELLTDAAVATDGVNISREPFVLQKSLDDFYVSYELNAYTDIPDQSPRIYSDLHANIQDRFNAAGVEIMSPHYRANREGPSKIPAVEK